MFDTLVAGRLGRLLPESAPLDRIARSRDGRIRALVAATRATEVDDIALNGCVTAGSVIVPVALVQAAERGADPQATLRAIVAGYQAMIAFADAINGASVLYRGIWPTLVAAPLGAAAVAGTLARLDAAAMESALAMAVGRSTWWSDRAVPRWLQLGHAAVEGVAAAEAAEAGFQAAPSAIDGWAAASGLVLDPSTLRSGGLRHIHQVECKTFPAARQGLAAVQAFMRLCAEHPVAETDRIEIGLPAAYRRMVGSTVLPTERIGSLLSAAYQIALVALAPERLYDVVRAPPRADAAIVRFLGRVSVVDDARLSETYPRCWGARVAVVSTNGERREAAVLEPFGGAAHPLGWAELADKAATLATANGLSRDLFVPLRAAVQQDANAAELLTLSGVFAGEA